MMHWRTSNKISAYIKMRTLMGTCHPKLQVFCKDLETEGSQVYDVAHSCRLLYTVVLYSVSWVTFNQDSKPTMDLMLESAHVSVHSTCSCHQRGQGRFHHVVLGKYIQHGSIPNQDPNKEPQELPSSHKTQAATFCIHSSQRHMLYQYVVLHQMHNLCTNRGWLIGSFIHETKPSPITCLIASQDWECDSQC